MALINFILYISIFGQAYINALTPSKWDFATSKNAKSARSFSSEHNADVSSRRRILVTGANTGIGLALTKQLVADYGCHVYLGSRNIEKGIKAVEEVKREAGDSVELLAIDVGIDESVKSAASELSLRVGSEKLYAIVNNAGIGFSDGSPPSKIVDINTRGPKRVIDNFLPLLDSSCGRIVNLGSGAGPSYLSMLHSTKDRKRLLSAMDDEEIEEEIKRIVGMNDSYAAYAGSKALIACYTMALAKKHPNLIVSALTPGIYSSLCTQLINEQGFIKTNMTIGSGATKEPHEGTVSLRKCLFDELPNSGYFWGSDGLRSPLHYLRNPGDPEYDGTLPPW